MTAYNLYEVYCIEEAAFRRVTSFTEPTQCPVSHADRSIDPMQTVIIDSIPIIGNKRTSYTPKKEAVTSRTYYNIGCAFHFDATAMENITDVKLLSYMYKKGADSDYTIRVYDQTHGLEMGSATFSNESLGVISIGKLVNLPTENAIIEFHAKVKNPADVAYISNIDVYYMSSTR